MRMWPHSHSYMSLTFIQDEVTRLRRYLATQPGPSLDEPVTLPPALISALLPHINNAASGGERATSGSSTVTAALTQRARLLQDENEELYGLLNLGETGKLKEEVRGLRRVVDRLEGALRGTQNYFMGDLNRKLMVRGRVSSSDCWTVVCASPHQRLSELIMPS